ncbi:hypothetical protein [Streptomyces sp. NPDC050264]|uniref:hypothetical protein n=1 Tax=Streptomyces sp. NPDC050264 TaxID=3155038 RepID=UPI00342EF77D
MTEFRIGDQRAGLIQNADVIINASPAATDHQAAAEGALRARDYGTAIARLKEHLAAEPADSLARFRLVVAALRGRHPDRYEAGQIHRLTARLVRLAADDPGCHHAKVLAVVINDGMLSRSRTSPLPPSADTLRLVAAVVRTAPGRAREIVEHVPVPESPTWAELRRALGAAPPRS